MLSADLLHKYGLPEDEIVDAVECAVARTLTTAFHRRVVVRAEGELEIIAYPALGHPVEIPLKSISKKLRRHIIHNVEAELQKRQIVQESMILQELQGRVFTGVVGRIGSLGTLHVTLEIDDVFKPLILFCECPLRYQPPHERSMYRIGEQRSFLVTSVRPVMVSDDVAKVRIVLNRTSRTLPALLLENLTGIAGIECRRRIAGGFSELVTPVRLPKASINTVGKELKEHVQVLIAQKNNQL
jgi:hypothetical protein